MPGHFVAKMDDDKLATNLLIEKLREKHSWWTKKIWEDNMEEVDYKEIDHKTQSFELYLPPNVTAVFSLSTASSMAALLAALILNFLIMGAFQDRFNMAPPRKATLLDWERCAFAFGTVKHRPRSGRKKTREETCAGVATSIEQSPINCKDYVDYFGPTLVMQRHYLRTQECSTGTETEVILVDFLMQSRKSTRSNWYLRTQECSTGTETEVILVDFLMQSRKSTRSNWVGNK
ncbi:hypothetical protein C0J52_01821 [Blattella germanica]|nr:hypothetical protein C0J52_01821 [Blattella germanica]